MVALIPRSRAWRAVAAVVLCLLAFLLGWLFGWSALPPGASGHVETQPALSPRDVSRLLDQLGGGLRPALLAGREALLGTCDPNRVPVRTLAAGRWKLPLPCHPQGGLAARLTYLYGVSPRTLPEFCRWREQTLRPLLEQWRRENAAAAAAVATQYTLAVQLRQALSRPGRLPPAGTLPPTPELPGRVAETFRALREALAADDLPAARLWSGELTAALFALGDLHRWADFLLGNHLAAIDFGTRCEELFAFADGKLGSGLEKLNEWLPSFTLLPPRIYNCLEIERQARELLLAGDFATHEAPCPDPAAVHMPPDAREAFLRLRSAMQPAVRSLWDQAARTPFERSYLANMLRRACESGRLDELATVLDRFEKAPARPTLARLMDVIYYRGSLTEAVAPGDRYDPRLVTASTRLGGDDAAVFRDAHRMARNVLRGWSRYEGGIWTLVEAIDRGRLDCVRGTDLVAALYRNAGRAGFRLLRISCGTAGHALPAFGDPDGAGPLRFLDVLSDRPEGTWPAAFFGGFQWPDGYPGTRGPAFAVELFARGLDNYVFAAGYVIRGRHAGELVRAAVPYLPGHAAAGVEKVHPGPYPPWPPQSASARPGVPEEPYRLVVSP